MAEYIKRQTVFDSLPIVTEDKTISLYGAVADFMVLVSAIPAADVVEVRHKLWVHDYNNVYGCTGCGERETMSRKKLKKFCPNCGARMDGDIK